MTNGELYAKLITDLNDYRKAYLFSEKDCSEARKRGEPNEYYEARMQEYNGVSVYIAKLLAKMDGKDDYYPYLHAIDKDFDKGANNDLS